MLFRKLRKNKAIFMDAAAGRANPSALYKEGIEAKKKLEEARTRIARILHVQARDIIFTSGGTESDNLAILGVFEAARSKQVHPHIIITSAEHPAVLESALEAERRGAKVTHIDTIGGKVRAEDVLGAVQDNTVLVSVMYVNNETGAINPISKIAHGLKHIPLHTDASQAAGLLSLDVPTLGANLVTLDAGKIGGPKGLGLLVVRPGVDIKSILFGGGQERGLRPGTENVDAVVQFAEALERADKRKTETLKHLEHLQQLFIEEIKAHVPLAVINTPKESVPSIVSVTIPNALHEFVAIKLAERGVFVSTGSSCSSSKRVDEKEALRFSFGETTSESDVHAAVRTLAQVVIQ